MPFHAHARGVTSPHVAAFVAFARNACCAVNRIAAWHCAAIDGHPGPSVEKIVIRASTPAAFVTASIDASGPLREMPPPARTYMPGSSFRATFDPMDHP